MVFINFLIVAFVLIINFLIAREFYHVAQAKGYDETKYLGIAFFVPIAGYLLVIALPNRANTQEQVQAVAIDKLPEL